jgi:hypothetical protein
MDVGPKDIATAARNSNAMPNFVIDTAERIADELVTTGQASHVGRRGMAGFFYDETIDITDSTPTSGPFDEPAPIRVQARTISATESRAQRWGSNHSRRKTPTAYHTPCEDCGGIHAGACDRHLWITLCSHLWFIGLGVVALFGGTGVIFR